MADVLTDRHPLPPLDGDDLALRPWSPARILSATAWSEESLARLVAALGVERPNDGRRAQAAPQGRVWWTAPRRALVIAETSDAPSLGEGEGWVMQAETGAHVGFRVAGGTARRLLARLVPIDLAEAVFPIDAFATTRADGVLVHVQRRIAEAAPEGDGFDLMVARSQGRFFAEILVDAATAFGVTVPDEMRRGTAARRLSSREVFGPSR
ncbi:aminomethyltransferase family protein [Siculibacillus lacustris]|uniref:hypothetical protein n=1 Tax=Siculibacillus lacustris TaxID=1549641 RepID=UPI0013F1636D|nr:hypothetical protein [Siculibacillus lacustris]